MIFPTISSKKAVLILGIGLGIMLVVLWSSQPAARAQKKELPSTTADLKSLGETFGASQVAVICLNNNPPPVEGRIFAVVDVFGRRYLHIRTNAGKNWLINGEHIVAIKQKD